MSKSTVHEFRIFVNHVREYANATHTDDFSVKNDGDRYYGIVHAEPPAEFHGRPGSLRVMVLVGYDRRTATRYMIG